MDMGQTESGGTDGGGTGSCGGMGTSAHDTSAFGDDDAHICPICFETFADPKVFPCGHSVCAECVDGLVASVVGQGARNRINCVICRSAVTVGNGGLPTNFSLAKLIEAMRERKDGRVGSKEKCTACDKGTPKDEIWFCLSCAPDRRSSKCAEDDDDQEALLQRGLQALCPSCTIRHHNGHKVSLFNDSVRRRQIRRCFDNMEECLESLKSLNLKLDEDWRLLADTIVRLGTEEYGRRPADFGTIHSQLATLCQAMSREGWLRDGPPSGANARSRLLHHLVRACRSFIAQFTAEDVAADGAPSPKRSRMDASSASVDASWEEEEKENAAVATERRKLKGFAKLLGELYVKDVGGFCEVVTGTGTALLLGVEDPNAARLEAVTELVAILGPAWSKRETGSKNGPFLGLILDRLRVESVIKAEGLSAPVRAYMKATLERAKRGWASAEETEEGTSTPTATCLSAKAAAFFQRRLQEDLYDES